MKALVIHPTDISTQFLSPIYEGKDWTIMSFAKSKKELKLAIKEHDRIIMMGHGDGYGLFAKHFYEQDFYGPREDCAGYIIDSTLVYLLREKECVFIWCNANEFVKKYQLKGFHTGMIISEYEEAMLCCIHNFSIAEVEESNKLFASSIKESIDSKEMLNEVKLRYENKNDNPIISFNQRNILYS